MLFKFPKDDKYFSWTRHVKDKMLQYRLSEQKIKAVLKSPDRKEEGIAPKTLAVMKRNDTPKRKQEVWVMYQQKQSNVKSQMSKVIVISAWRYPGISPKGKQIPIPEDILKELENLVDE
jgi:hypothetical protein